MRTSFHTYGGPFSLDNDTARMVTDIKLTTESACVRCANKPTIELAFPDTFARIYDTRASFPTGPGNGQDLTPSCRVLQSYWRISIGVPCPCKIATDNVTNGCSLSQPGTSTDCMKGFFMQDQPEANALGSFSRDAQNVAVPRFRHAGSGMRALFSSED